MFITGDIDLSSFGPYYGDASSDLDAFEASLARAREVDANHYVTFHHKGVIDSRDAYVQAIDAFTAVIATRERRMVEFLPRRSAHAGRAAPSIDSCTART